MKQICVSVFMLTYNQEEFITQAIEGVLMQDTSFTYELVIGEDFSTDNTRNICLKYAEKYPDKIKLLLNERNMGLGANYVRTYSECTGKYVAICDGDDYWIDPLKLQKQVDFLNENPNYKIIYTNKYDLYPTKEIRGPKKDKRPLTTEFDDLVKGNYIASVTVLFKKEPLTPKMEEWIPLFPYGDWPTYLLVLRRGGKIYFLDRPTAVYRKDFGTSTVLRKEKSKLGQINLAILQNLLKDEAFKSRKTSLEESIISHKIGLMGSYNKEKKFLSSVCLLKQLFWRKPKFKFLRLYIFSLRRSWNN